MEIPCCLVFTLNVTLFLLSKIVALSWLIFMCNKTFFSYSYFFQRFVLILAIPARLMIVSPLGDNPLCNTHCHRLSSSITICNMSIQISCYISFVLLLESILGCGDINFSHVSSAASWMCWLLVIVFAITCLFIYACLTILLYLI